MSDRVCIRGCTQRGVHYATCAWYGIAEGLVAEVAALPNTPSVCKGCAPRECRDGSLICDKCFGRMRALLADVPDLHGRLRAIGDPTKATPLDQVRVASSSVEAPAPVGADLLDALAIVEQAVDWSYVNLSDYTNQLDTVTYLAELLLTRHDEIDGIRPAWSVQDAVDKWGVERRDRNPQEWEDDDDRAEIVEPVSEWGTPIIGREEAEGIAGSASTLRRWVKAGDVTPLGTIYVAGIRTRTYRRAELVACREQMRARQQSGLVQNRDDQTESV